MKQIEVRKLVGRKVEEVLSADKDNRKSVSPVIEERFIRAFYNPDKRLDDK